jgi:hypothetical protein
LFSFVLSIDSAIFAAASSSLSSLAATASFATPAHLSVFSSSLRSPAAVVSASADLVLVSIAAVSISTVFLAARAPSLEGNHL